MRQLCGKLHMNPCTGNDWQRNFAPVGANTFIGLHLQWMWMWNSSYYYHFHGGARNTTCHIQIHCLYIVLPVDVWIWENISISMKLNKNRVIICKVRLLYRYLIILNSIHDECVTDVQKCVRISSIQYAK